MEVNRHHLFHARAWYKTPLEKALRQHDGLVVPMYVGVHKELHANVQPPPKPNQRLILGALACLDDLPGSTLAHPPQAVLALTEHFLEQDDRLAQRLGHSLLEQASYIQEGYWSNV